MAKLKIKMPANVNYNEKWANVRDKEEIIAIPAYDGGKEKETDREEK